MTNATAAAKGRADAVRLVRAGEGETLWVVRDRVTFRGRLPGTDMVVAEVEVPPHAGTPLHSHSSPEVLRVLAGELEVTTVAAGGRPERRRAGAGDLVEVPSGAPHGYRNAGGSTAVVLAVFDLRLERFFREVGVAGERAPEGPPGAEEIARVLAAAEAHGMRIYDETEEVAAGRD